MKTRERLTLVLLVLAVQLAALSSSSEAVPSCKVRVSSKTGMIDVSADGVSGPLLWGDRPGSASMSFACPRAIGQLSATLPREKQMFGDIMSTHGQASILVCRLIERVEDRVARLALANVIGSEDGPVPSLASVLRWLRPSKENSGPAALNDEESAEVATTLAERIRLESEGAALFDLYPNDFHRLIWVWRTWGAPGAATAYLYVVRVFWTIRARE